MQVIVCLEPNKIKNKELLFVLSLWSQVIGSFIISVLLGVKLDQTLGTKPLFILILFFLAFVYVMKLLLGVGKNG